MTQRYCLNYIPVRIFLLFPGQHGRPNEHLLVFRVKARAFPLHDLASVLCRPFTLEASVLCMHQNDCWFTLHGL